MNAFDVFLLCVTGILVLVGLVKGLARILVGIASLVVAFFLASHFQGVVGDRLVSMHVQPAAARLVAYLLIFLATMIAGGVVAFVLSKILKAAMLSWADRLAGAALGLVAAVLAAAFVVHPIVASSAYGASLLQHSALAPYVSVIADLVNVGAPKDLADRYRKEIDVLRRLWRGETVEPKPPKPPVTRT